MDFDESRSVSGHCPHHGTNFSISARFKVFSTGKGLGYTYTGFKCRSSRDCTYYGLKKCPIEESAKYMDLIESQ